MYYILGDESLANQFASYIEEQHKPLIHILTLYHSLHKYKTLESSELRAGSALSLWGEMRPLISALFYPFFLSVHF